MKKIHVTMVVNNLDVGGLEKVVLSLLSSLPKTEFELSIACLKGPGKLYDRLELPESHRLVLTTDKPVNLGLVRADLRTLLSLRRFLAKMKTDIVHAHNLAPLIYGGVAARSMLPRPRIVYSEHNQVQSLSPRGLQKFGYYIRLADAVIAVSENLRDGLVNELGVTRPVHVIRNGIDDSGFSNVTGDRVRSELGVEAGEVLIGTAAGLRVQKGLTNLIQAAKSVLARAPNARFAIAGDGPLRAELEGEAKAAGLGDRMLFLGYRSDIPELLASFDVYVLPSLREGLPLALLEALCLGKFIVCTAVGGNPEVVGDAVHGFLVPPAEPKALADALVRAVGDPALRARARKLSPRRFKDRFTLEAMTRGHVKLFDSLVRRAPR